MTRVIAVEDVGFADTLDLEIDHPDHQFYLSAGPLCSNSHAVSYAMDSYFCAWLLTHHEEEWLLAYLESMSETPENRAKAFSEVRSLGWKIEKLDINTAHRTWTALPGRRFVPSLVSCKGVGDSAVDELERLRPFASFEQMLWNPDGTWRLSKFNRRAFEAMVKLEAFDSLGCVGEGGLFSSYAHMHSVMTVAWDEARKSSKRNPWVGRDSVIAVAAATRDTIEAWTPTERLKNRVEVTGSADVSLLVPERVMEKLVEKGVSSIDEAADSTEPTVAWFAVSKATRKTTKTNKPYYVIEALGPVGRARRVYAWGMQQEPPALAVMMAPLEKSDFGFSANRVVRLA